MLMVLFLHKLHCEPQTSEIGGRESGTELWLLSPENILGRSEHKAGKICFAVKKKKNKKEKEKKIRWISHSHWVSRNTFYSFKFLMISFCTVYQNIGACTKYRYPPQDAMVVFTESLAYEALSSSDGCEVCVTLSLSRNIWVADDMLVTWLDLYHLFKESESVCVCACTCASVHVYTCAPICILVKKKRGGEKKKNLAAFLKKVFRIAWFPWMLSQKLLIRWTSIQHRTDVK